MNSQTDVMNYIKGGMRRTGGGVLDFWNKYKRNKIGVAGLGIIIFFTLMAILAPVISPYNPNTINSSLYLSPPSSAHLLGTDSLGRDLLSRDFYGAQISLIVGFAAAAISVFVGLVIGLYSGYFGGWADEILMRVTDFFLVIPTLVFMIVIAAVIGPSLVNVILVIGLLSWPSTARTIRSMVLSIKNWPFIESAMINGGKSNYIIFRHIAPNVFPVVFANAVMSVASAIFAQASLVFLGVGDITDISWGGIIHNAFAFGAVSAGMWWYVIPPGLFIILVILGFTMTGYSLEEMFNPKKRGF